MVARVPLAVLLATLMAEHPKDICDCGDYRDQHEPGGGPCRFNEPGGRGHRPAPDCHSFRLFRSVEASTHVGKLGAPVRFEIGYADGVPMHVAMVDGPARE